MHYAHSTATPNSSNWQPLRDHLKQTALRAKMFGSKFGAAKSAALAGWLHDLGKYSAPYQAYIGGRGPGGVDHSTAGTQQVMKLGLKGPDQGMAELIAYAIAGHHAGLADMTGADGEASRRSHSDHSIFRSARRQIASTLDPNQRSRADGPDFLQNRMRYW